MSSSLLSIDVSSEPEKAVALLREACFRLRQLRKVRVWRDRLQVFDINGDYLEMLGVGYPDAAIRPLLDQVNTAYNPATIHSPTEEPFKELKTGRRYPWAADRVM